MNYPGYYNTIYLIINNHPPIANLTPIYLLFLLLILGV